MKAITYYEKQLILYTKGHFGPVNYDNDVLKLFAAKLYDLEINRVDPYNINHMVIYLYEALVEQGFIVKPLINLFDMFFKEANKDQRKAVLAQDITITLLKLMQGIKVKDDNDSFLIELGTADKNLKKEIETLMQTKTPKKGRR